MRTEEPIGKYEKPLEQIGYKEEMDLSKEENQKKIMEMADDERGPNLWVIEPPCASFSNLHKMGSAGTRSVEHPEGKPGQTN